MKQPEAELAFGTHCALEYLASEQARSSTMKLSWLAGVVPVERMTGDNDEDTTLLRGMSKGG